MRSLPHRFPTPMLEPQVSRARKVLRRTVTGAGLTLALALALYVVRRSESGAVVLVGGSVVAFACAVEASCMGSFRGRALLAVMLAPLATLVALGKATLDGRALLGTARIEFDRWMLRDRVYPPQLVWELALVVLLAAIGQGVVRMARSEVRAQKFAAGALALYALAALVLFLGNATRDLGVNEGALGTRGLAVVLALPALPAAAWQVRERERRKDLLRAVGLSSWLLAPLVWIVHVWVRYGFHGLLALIVLAKVGDVFAYFAGTAFGRHHPFPRISPGKTIEGCAASLAGAAACGALLAANGCTPDGSHGVLGGLAAGALINLSAQSSDLLESWVKRRAGVKDSSRALGASGGVIDVIDSLLLAVPTALVTWPWLFHGVA